MDNKAIARRFFELFEQGDLDTIERELLSPNMAAHQPGMPGPLDRAGFRQVGEMFLTAFPDLRMTIEAQVAEGDKIFHCQEAGGTCTACHGQDAKGTAMAPNLTDSEWLNGDGSLAFIEHTVTTGVPKPKSHPAPMPPMGGASLNPDQVKAVAAYVYSLSHKS